MALPFVCKSLVVEDADSRLAESEWEEHRHTVTEEAEYTAAEEGELHKVGRLVLVVCSDHSEPVFLESLGLVGDLVPENIHRIIF